VDFYSRQAAARRQSKWLLAGFLVSVALVVVAINAVVGTAVVAAGESQSLPAAIFFTSCVVLAIIAGASLYRTMQLRDGGGVVARALGGTRVERGTDDPLHQRLINVVEEMSIASGVPMPEVYVLENEEGINAFAAGHLPANAAVAVTHGALKRLNRDELQGVIAHEFSHVLNGDMAINIRLMGWLFGLLVLATTARLVLQHGPRRSGDSKGSGGALIALALAVMLLGYIGLFFGRLLQAAVSRQREKLADSSAVQFTRNPGGLKGALLKIAGVQFGSTVGAADAEEVAHMLFASGFKRFFATHPPLLERIQALDPAFKPAMLDRAAAEAVRASLDVGGADLAADRRAQTSGVAAAGTVDASKVAAQVGQPETLHVMHARSINAAIPPIIRSAAASPERALPVLLALLTGRDSQRSVPQRRFIETAFGAPLVQAVDAARDQLGDVAAQLRLPAAQLLFPTLRRMTLVDRRTLLALAQDLARIDAEIDTFECALITLLAADLRDELRGRVPTGSAPLDARLASLATVFAVLARHGASDDVSARRSYEAGLASVLPRERPPYAEPADWPIAFAQALNDLEALHPFAKRAVVEGLVKTIAHDSQLNVPEAELLRTVCAVLRCPLPPLLPAAQV
jgi:Zn-dependent protease with chaperone function